MIFPLYQRISLQHLSGGGSWDTAYGEELEEQAELSITETELENPVRPNLRDRGNPSCLQTLSQPGNEHRWSRCCRSREFG